MLRIYIHFQRRGASVTLTSAHKDKIFLSKYYNPLISLTIIEVVSGAT